MKCDINKIVKKCDEEYNNKKYIKWPIYCKNDNKKIDKKVKDYYAKCKKCSRTFNRTRDWDKHLEKKFDCTPKKKLIEGEYYCIFCNVAYSKFYINMHVKKCKINPDNMVNLDIANDGDDNMKIDNPTKINDKIILPYGDEDIGHIDVEYLNTLFKSIKEIWKIPVEYIKDTFCNIDKPENHNIYADDKTHAFYNGHKFVSYAQAIFLWLLKMILLNQ